MPVAFTPRRILVAVDFSEPSRTALRFGARLAVQCSAELHVLHAEDPLLSAAARAGGIDLRDETLEELPRFIDASALPPGAWSASPTAAGAFDPIAPRGLRMDGPSLDHRQRWNDVGQFEGSVQRLRQASGGRR